MTEIDWETPKPETRAERVERLVGEVTKEIRKVHKTQYSQEESEKTAALALEAQFELTEFLSEAELISKEKKLEVEHAEAEKYIQFKTSPPDGIVKPTDQAIKALVSKDVEVNQAKKAQYKSEADYNKWKNLFGTLKDAHILFRGLAKGKNE